MEKGCQLIIVCALSDNISDEPQPLGSTLAFGTQRKLHKKFKRGIPSGSTKRTNFKKCAQQNGQPNIICNGSSDCKDPKWWNQIFISLTELFVK